MAPSTSVNALASSKPRSRRARAPYSRPPREATKATAPQDGTRRKTRPVGEWAPSLSDFTQALQFQKASSLNERHPPVDHPKTASEAPNRDHSNQSQAPRSKSIFFKNTLASSSSNLAPPAFKTKIGSNPRPWVSDSGVFGSSQASNAPVIQAQVITAARSTPLIDLTQSPPSSPTHRISPNPSGSVSIPTVFDKIQADRLNLRSFNSRHGCTQQAQHIQNFVSRLDGTSGPTISRQLSQSPKQGHPVSQLQHTPCHSSQDRFAFMSSPLFSPSTKRLAQNFITTPSSPRPSDNLCKNAGSDHESYEIESDSSDDDRHVESILLGRPPIEDSLPSPSPLPPPEPRFLASDLKWLPVYLCNPVATILTNCSSLTIPTVPIPGFSSDDPEENLANAPWRVKRETISAPGVNHRIDCWVNNNGWPAKTFTVCGWIVGIDRREHWLNYYVDDGTAVLECNIPISQLERIFNLSQESDADDADQPIGQSWRQVKSDPRLDPYRPLPSPRFRSRKLQSPSKTPCPNHLPTEETIDRYANLPIATTLKLTGQPKELFRSTRRVLSVEKVSILEHPNEEIEFHRQLRNLRETFYNQLPFRLSKIWPDGLNQATNSLHDRLPSCSRQQPPSGLTNQARPIKRLRLPAVKTLRPEQLTFSRFVNYLAHHVSLCYSQEKDPNKKKFTIEDLMQTTELLQFSEELIRIEQDEIKGKKKESMMIEHQTKPSTILYKDPSINKFKKTSVKKIFEIASIELVRQGTIVISPDDGSEKFTLPDKDSLGISLMNLFKKQSRLESNEIVSKLKSDELWKYLDDQLIFQVLVDLGGNRTNQGKWTLSTI